MPIARGPSTDGGLQPAAIGVQGIRIDGRDPVWIEGNLAVWPPYRGIQIGEDPGTNVVRVDVVGHFVGNSTGAPEQGFAARWMLGCLVVSGRSARRARIGLIERSRRSGADPRPGV